MSAHKHPHIYIYNVMYFEIISDKLHTEACTHNMHIPQPWETQRDFQCPNFTLDFLLIPWKLWS